MIIRPFSVGAPVILLCVLGGFLVKLPAQQSAGADVRYEIAYATYLGGKSFEQAREIIVYPDNSSPLLDGDADAVGGGGLEQPAECLIGPQVSFDQHPHRPVLRLEIAAAHEIQVAALSGDLRGGAMLAGYVGVVVLGAVEAGDKGGVSRALGPALATNFPSGQKPRRRAWVSW